jgi:hypothetical protein
LRNAQAFGLNIPTPLFRHILPALVALPTEAMLATKLPAQSPYPGCKNFLIAAQAASKQPERYAMEGYTTYTLFLYIKSINSLYSLL